MPAQATLSNECVVDRRRTARRLSQRTSPKQSAAKARQTTPSFNPSIDDELTDDLELDASSDDERQVERRRQIDPTTCERDYGNEEIEFMTAMDDYKRRSGRQFPTWSEVLEVLRDLGYRKVAEPTQTYSGEE